MAFELKTRFNFKKNVGTQEQQKRYALGSIALLISVFTASIPLLLLGGILVATAKMSWCPVSSGLGKNTFGGSEIKTGGTSLH
ncbi:MAG: YgaP family membrane protein [Methylococcales bacterium]